MVQRSKATASIGHLDADTPALIAHRGYARWFPENTLLALDAAVAAGADFVEVDVRLSADNVPVLFHDEDCLRLCGVPGAIEGRQLEAIRVLSAYAPESFGYRYRGTPIPTLAEFAHWLASHPQVTAFVEIKRSPSDRFAAAAYVHTVYEVLKPVLAQTVLISFSQAVLVDARRLWSRIGYIVGAPASFSKGPRNVAFDYIFCDIRKLPRTGPLHRHAPVAVYEVADVAIAQDLAERGAAFIETFAIGEMRAALSL